MPINPYEPPQEVNENPGSASGWRKPNYFGAAYWSVVLIITSLLFSNAWSLYQHPMTKWGGAQGMCAAVLPMSMSLYFIWRAFRSAARQDANKP